jgi:hypothetical protein
MQEERMKGREEHSGMKWPAQTVKGQRMRAEEEEEEERMKRRESRRTGMKWPSTEAGEGRQRWRTRKKRNRRGTIGEGKEGKQTQKERGAPRSIYAFFIILTRRNLSWPLQLD